MCGKIDSPTPARPLSKPSMHKMSAKDGPLQIDWGKTSADYAQWRPDYPPDFYLRLAALGVGRPGQTILDLGTGVGYLARNFARQGCLVAGVDISAGQIAEARRCAERERLSIDFRVAPAEETGFPDGAFDAVTASQCWLYFDRERAIAEVKRLLRPGGLLATCHFCWLPRLDSIARASEELVLQFNPHWSAAGWSGEIPAIPGWAEGRFRLVGMFVFDTRIRFTREQWRGRIRACRGVGASLLPEDVSRFDAAHDELLEKIAPESFTVLHRIDCHLLQPIS
jgi:SAM-dependent methyltransferase